MDFVPLRPADGTERADAPPQPHGDEVVDMDRKRAVDVGDLGQIGDVAGGNAMAIDRAGQRRQMPGDAFE